MLRIFFKFVNNRQQRKTCIAFWLSADDNQRAFPQTTFPIFFLAN